MNILSYFQVDISQIICVESEDYRLEDEIEKIKIEIELIRTLIKADVDTLAILGDKIRTSMGNDPEYAKKEAFFKLLSDETRITQDYIDNVKKLAKLRTRYFKLVKKRFST